MAKQNRNTLRRYFEKGRMPNEDQFGDLIDSTLNPIDEGFDKTFKHGFEISLIGKHKRLISFFKANVPEKAVWTIEYDNEQERLLIRQPAADLPADGDGDVDDSAPIAMTFSQDSYVGINNAAPACELDVGGWIAAQGRIGANPDGFKTVAADGKWHDVTPALPGCQAIEVMAGVGSKGTGKYALMNAIAMNAFNPRGWIFNFFNLKNRIKYHHAYYLSRGDRIKLRWFTKENGYCLQMRTACSFGDGIKIRFYLTKLWSDWEMKESWQASVKD
jgi:hypothetical protein